MDITITLTQEEFDRLIKAIEFGIKLDNSMADYLDKTKHNERDYWEEIQREEWIDYQERESKADHALLKKLKEYEQQSESR